MCCHLTYWIPSSCMKRDSYVHWEISRHHNDRVAHPGWQTDPVAVIIFRRLPIHIFATSDGGFVQDCVCIAKVVLVLLSMCVCGFVLLLCTCACVNIVRMIYKLHSFLSTSAVDGFNSFVRISSLGMCNQPCYCTTCSSPHSELLLYTL